MTIIMTEPLALLRLMQLVSPALPIGAYNFSQGLEYAIEQQWVRDEASALTWIESLARHSLGTLDLPLLLRLQQAWEADDRARVVALSRQLVASRETAELRAEERHLGQALAKVLVELGVEEARTWLRQPDTSYAAMFTLAAARHGIAATQTAQGYLWAWAENQVLCAVKLLPLGQSSGQRVLDRLLVQIPSLVTAAQALEDEDIGTATPLAAMASAWHESQYTRLFRS
jgi:urease accessory protein